MARTWNNSPFSDPMLGEYGGDVTSVGVDGIVSFSSDIVDMDNWDPLRKGAITNVE